MLPKLIHTYQHHHLAMYEHTAAKVLTPDCRT
jgi:hypothetical protein